MAIRNQAWYDLNSARAYPLDDAALALSDQGVRLPSHFLADLYLKFPERAGPCAFLSALTVNDNVVTAIISASLRTYFEDLAQLAERYKRWNTLSASWWSQLTADDWATLLGELRPDVLPIAAISLAQPVEPWRQYAMEPLFPGTGGWIVFGHGVHDQRPFTARFSTAAQAGLCLRSAKAYRPFPIPDIAKLDHASRLSGVVKLTAGEDIEIVKDRREVPGFGWRDCAVIRLKNTSTASTDRNVANSYRGPCSGAPESETCGELAPIEFLGPVQPDCCGNILIKFRGCAVVSAVTAAATLDEEGNATSAPASGVVIDCGLGLLDACVTADYLPAPDGRLPNEYDDLCSLSAPLTSISEDVPMLASLEPLEAIFVEVSSLSFSVGDWETDFADADAWTVRSGHFGLANVLGSALPGSAKEFSTHFTNSAASMNVALCTAFAASFVRGRKISTVVTIDQGDVGTAHNAAVLVNVRNLPDNSGRFTAFAAELDWDAFVQGAKLFRIAYYDGDQWYTLAAVELSKLALRSAYRLSLSVAPAGLTGAWLTGELTTVSGVGSVSANLGPIYIADFGPDDGEAACGLHTKRARARFHWFGIHTL